MTNLEDLEYKTERSCLICKEQCVDQEILSNGTTYHAKCFDDMEVEYYSYRNQLSNEVNTLKQKAFEIGKELDYENSFIGSIKRLFSNVHPAEKINELETSLRQIRDDLEHLYSRQLSHRNNKFETAIYDYWLTYPPDWEERKSSVWDNFSECSSCNRKTGRNTVPFHVHHIQPISSGGNHTLKNLTLLCENCHSTAHNGMDFDAIHDHKINAYSDDGKDGQSIGAYGKRIILLEKAINNALTVGFQYRDNEGIKTTRNINPIEFRTFDHRTGTGETFCVVGYCHLRQANRIFAIKRMRGLKVV